LKQEGFDPGPIDGTLGSQTRAALRQYQAKRGLPVTGLPDEATQKALGVQTQTDKEQKRDTTAHEEKIHQFLQSMGFPAQLAPWPGAPTLKVATVSYAGLQINVVLAQDTFIFNQIGLGFVPEANVTPFYRRLLTLNTILGGPFFAIYDDNGVVLRVLRIMERVDLVEFRWMFDILASTYWQHGLRLREEFQILTRRP
jgi:hypothetical protein